MNGARPAGPSALLSACLIVRDEEAVLAACLESLRGMVDEIVVHDTGSTDGTVALARAAGAHVIEGSWHDDFAEARNAALAACTSTWILHIDADEVLAGNSRAVRRALAATAPSVDAYVVEIDNLLDDGTGHSYTSRGCRVFRRQRAEWVGCIHEQVVARTGQPPVVMSTRTLPVRIVHGGYLRAAMTGHGKVDRNLRIAQLAVERSAENVTPESLLDLGRSLKAAGRLEDAAAACLRAASAAPGTPTAASALHFASSCLLGLGRVDDALASITALRSIAVRPSIPDFLEAEAELQRGNAARALELLDGIDDPVDDRGKRLAPGVLPLNRGMAFALLARWDDAADALADAVLVHRAVQGNVGFLVEVFAMAGRPLAALAALLTEELVEPLLGELAQLPPAKADVVAQALWAAFSGDTRIVERVAALAPALGLETAVTWAIRLREAGIEHPCPLLTLAGDSTVDAAVRVYAAATVVAIGDGRGADALVAAAPLVPEAAFRAVLLELNDLSPQVLPVFAGAGASTVGRALAMGRVLHELGAPDEGCTVVEAAVRASRGDDDNVVVEAARAWLAAAGHTAGTPFHHAG